jgi:uncharacterized membrane protein
MLQILILLANWFHSLAAVIMIGHYLLLSVIYLPAMSGSRPELSGLVLSEISKRSRGWLYTCLLVFLVSGVYLMTLNSRYLGIGNFGNVWTVLMLVKHLLILVMIAAGFWFNAILRVGPLMASTSGAAQALLRFRSYSRLMAALGVAVLLLTAVAQSA